MSKKPHIETGMGVRKFKIQAEEVNLHMTVYDENRKSLEAYHTLMAEFQKIALRELQIPISMVKSWGTLTEEKAPVKKVNKKKDSERSVPQKETKKDD